MNGVLQVYENEEDRSEPGTMRLKPLRVLRENFVLFTNYTREYGCFQVHHIYQRKLAKMIKLIGGLRFFSYYFPN